LDKAKAARIIEETSQSNHLAKANVSTLIDAVHVWFGLGQPDKANAILDQCDEKLLAHENHIENLIASDLVSNTELSLGIGKERALSINEKGLNEYEALSYFYRAHKMFPGVPVFALNLLQSLTDANQTEYKNVSIDELIKELSSITLSEKNAQRMDAIKEKLMKSA